MNLKLFVTLLATLFSFNIYAQITEHPHNDSEDHEHAKNEIGIANAPVYFLKEKVFAYGLHVHYLRNISTSKFGLGLGYERIFDKHKHNTFTLVSAYRPIDKLYLIVSPGLTFEDNHSQVNFALHLESSYEFEMKNFHFGPAFEIAYDPEDFHISLGLHLGYSF